MHLPCVHRVVVHLPLVQETLMHVPSLHDVLEPLLVEPNHRQSEGRQAARQAVREGGEGSCGASALTC